MSRLVHPLCTYCGIVLTHADSNSGDGICCDNFCRSKEVSRIAAEDQRLRTERREVLRILALENWRNDGTDSARSTEPVAVIVPAMLRQLSSSENRLAQFKRHLLGIAEEALTNPGSNMPLGGTSSTKQAGDTSKAETHDVAGSRFDVVSNFACGQCRGYCCTLGGDHAYLSAEVLRHHAERNHMESVEELVESYLQLVPEMVFEKSCIFHSANGCGLPRSMRSATCNNFYCTGLSNFRSCCSELPLKRTTVVVATTNEKDSTEAAPVLYSLRSCEV